MPEPITLEEAKAHLRVLSTDEDALITALIIAAREWVENETGHILVQRTVTDEHSGFGTFFDLMKRPFDPDSVTIDYTDTDGAAQTVGSVTVNGRRVRPAYNSWWPTARLYTPVTVNYTAGYADGEVPQSLIQAMLLLIGHWFDVRSGVNVGSSVSEVPLAVNGLCNQYRAPLV